MSKYTLIQDADLSHEDARDWYSSYGWHLTTESAGDVKHDAVEYDWLDGTDADAIAKLMAADGDLTEDEATSIVEKARTIREAGEAVESRLVEATEAYERGDVDGVVKSLDLAASIERDHGDTPAATSLRGQLVAELIQVGEWGYGDSTRGVSHWYATESNFEAVQAAYDSMDSDNLGPDCDADILAVGGIFLAE